MTALEQLRYTRVPRGVTGVGFQTVAATAGLRDPDDLLTETTKRLCRYTRPKGVEDAGAAPISYGWTQEGGTRFVFRCGYLGKDATLRPGNFYAHIVVGPVEALPVVELARRFDSPFWWRGGPVTDPDLPLVTLASLPPGQLPDLSGEELDDLTDAVFHGRGQTPVVLRRPPEVVAALVGVLVERLPEVFERLSVSTYEPASTAEEYDIVGMSPSDRPPIDALVDRPDELSPSLTRARRVVLSRDPGDRAVVRMAIAAAADRSAVRLGTVLRCLPIFAEAARGQLVEPAMLPPVLREPGSASALLQLDAGRTSTIDALLRSHRGVWESLAEALPTLDTETAIRLATALGAKIFSDVTERELSPLVQAVRSRLGEYADDCLVELLRTAPAAPARLAHVTTPARLDLLRVAAVTEPDHGVVDALLTAPPYACLTIADEPELPAAWRGKALARYFTLRPDPAEPVLARLDKSAGVTAHFAATLDTIRPLRKALLETTPARAARLAVNAAPSLPDQRRRALLTGLLPRLSVLARPDFLARGLTRGDTLSTGWDHVVSTAVGDALVVQWSQAGPPPTISEDVIRLVSRVPGSHCRSWAQIFHTPQRIDDVNTALQAITNLGQEEHKLAALHLVLLYAQSLLTNVESVRSTVLSLTVLGLAERQGAVALLLDACVIGRKSSSALACLCYVCDLVKTDELRTTRHGRLKDKALQQKSVIAARQLNFDKHHALARYVSTPGRATRWLNALYE